MFKQFSVIFLVAAISAVSAQSWFQSRPDGPDAVGRNVKFVFSVNKTFAYGFPLRDIGDVTKVPEFNRALPTMIYWHGWLENGSLDVSTTAIRGAYMDVGGYNVITADWGHYSKNIRYLSAVIPQMKIIAETFAENLVTFFRNYDPKLLTLVGHSLGGQMVGKIGRHMRKLSGDRYRISTIFALDPAGPGFETRPFPGMEPISMTDADYVQIIHTNGGTLGMQYRCGTLDFYPNGGEHQRGCDIDAASGLMASASTPCNHYRSWHFFQEALRNPKNFPAMRCNSYEDFINFENGGQCWKDDIVFMGPEASRNATGKYFLTTNVNLFNLGRGYDGLKPVNITKAKLPSFNNNFIDDDIEPFTSWFNDDYYL